MKWLSKLFKGGGSGNRGQQPQFLGDENMVWRAPARSMVILFSFYLHHFYFDVYDRPFNVLVTQKNCFNVSLFYIVVSIYVTYSIVNIIKERRGEQRVYFENYRLPVAWYAHDLLEIRFRL